MVLVRILMSKSDSIVTTSVDYAYMHTPLPPTDPPI
jgi:hypothetical protein